MNIAESLAAMPVSATDLSRYIEVTADTSVADTVDAMNAAGRSAACVMADGWLVGIFTQRDVMMRIIGRSRVWDHAVSEQMTRTVRTVRTNQSVADGMAIMTDWWVRSVPVLDEDEQLVGNLSYYTLMCLIADMVADHLADPDGQPEIRHSLTLVDFTGLNTSTPILVREDDPVATAAHHMRARAIGSVLVVDDHDRLKGVLTEFDLQTKIGCQHNDLTGIQVGDIMTKDPIALAVRSPIADAIEQMASRGFSHLPLLGESGKPAAVTSFRDIAAYLESSFLALA